MPTLGDDQSNQRFSDNPTSAYATLPVPKMLQKEEIPNLLQNASGVPSIAKPNAFRIGHEVDSESSEARAIQSHAKSHSVHGVELGGAWPKFFDVVMQNIETDHTSTHDLGMDSSRGRTSDDDGSATCNLRIVPDTTNAISADQDREPDTAKFQDRYHDISRCSQQNANVVDFDANGQDPGMSENGKKSDNQSSESIATKGLTGGRTVGDPAQLGTTAEAQAVANPSSLPRLALSGIARSNVSQETITEFWNCVCTLINSHTGEQVTGRMHQLWSHCPQTLHAVASLYSALCNRIAVPNLSISPAGTIVYVYSHKTYQDQNAAGTYAEVNVGSQAPGQWQSMQPQPLALEGMRQHSSPATITETGVVEPRTGDVRKLEDHADIRDPKRLRFAHNTNASFTAVDNNHLSYPSIRKSWAGNATNPHANSLTALPFESQPQLAQTPIDYIEIQARFDQTVMSTWKLRSNDWNDSQGFSNQIVDRSRTQIHAGLGCTQLQRTHVERFKQQHPLRTQPRRQKFRCVEPNHKEVVTGRNDGRLCTRCWNRHLRNAEWADGQRLPLM